MQPQAQKQAQPQYDPKLVKWMERNGKFWFNKDLVMTGGVKAIHEQLVAGEDLILHQIVITRRLINACALNFLTSFRSKRQSAQAVTPASAGRSAIKGAEKTVELTPVKCGFRQEDEYSS